MPTGDFKFYVVEKPWKVPSSGEIKAYLVRDNWDDYDQFETSFRLFVFDETGEKHEIGNLKIGTFGLKGASKTDAPVEGSRRPQIDETFERLNINAFSLGQDDSYYTQLMKFNAALRKKLLWGLRDLAADEEIWTRALSEAVVVKSLLRSVSKKTVEGQFRRILAGLPRLTPFYLEYKRTKIESETHGQLSLKFQVIPFKHPPQNIHVLIGRNGVGKSHSLYSMTKAFLGKNQGNEHEGEISMQDEWGNTSERITSLVSVSFSAFDPFEAFPDSESTDGALGYTYIGLRQNNVENNLQAPPKTFNDLAVEFSQSLYACLPDARVQRWKQLVATLETDPLFKEADVNALLDFQEDEDTFLDETQKAFEKLSSGHKIVLLTITRLVEKVEEQTLVLMDEPESHLHPPLLASFIRALSLLMIDRNGMAVIATHSPVVLQEVPKRCVWVLERLGEEIRADRPPTETFGENVGVLTRDVFGLEVPGSGFHLMLREAVEKNETYEEAEAEFHGELGGEAKALLRALFLTKKTRK